METKEKIKSAIRYLIGKGVSSNQKGIGLLLGYKTESAFSQVINGKVPRPEDFFDRLCSLDSRLNKNWFISDNGEMLLSEEYNVLEHEVMLIREQMEFYKEKIEFYKERIEKLETENKELKKNKQPNISMSRMAESETKLKK